MKEYPLQYASTDKNKKSHYSKIVFTRKSYMHLISLITT